MTPRTSLAETAETNLQDVVGVLVTVVEACGAVVIMTGAVWAFVQFVARTIEHRGRDGFVPVRLRLGRFLVLGLEFQLASDVLKTAVSPSFEQLAQLAVVAAIRTALNYVLTREIEEERRQVEAGDRPGTGQLPDATGGGDKA